MIDTKGFSTREVLKIAKRTAEKRGIRNVVIATTKGKSALLASEIFEDSAVDVLAVTHSTGFKNQGFQELSKELRTNLTEHGIKVLTCTMPFHGIEDSLRKEKGLYPIATAIADALRLSGQGTKVCVEIACMAVDAGEIPEGKDVVCAAGTGTGEDTVIVISSAASRHFTDLKIREFLAKPTDW